MNSTNLVLGFRTEQTPDVSRSQMSQLGGFEYVKVLEKIEGLEHFVQKWDECDIN